MVIKEKKGLCLTLLLAAAVFMAGCGSADGSKDENEPIVLEPGIENNDSGTVDDGQENEVEEFVDKGEATTVDDLVAAHDKITSYYFEQTIPYADGSVFLQVWYWNNLMKVVASAAGGEINESYYDYNEMTMIYYTPSEGNEAIKMDFDPQGEDAPDNPKDEDYRTCTQLGTEQIDGQLCYIMETSVGDKLWVSTKYGFPLQVQFVDHLGDTYTVEYCNVAINTVTAEDVAVPDDLNIYYLGGGSEL